MMDDGREKNGEGRRSREMWERSDCREESVVLYTEKCTHSDSSKEASMNWHESVKHAL